MRVWFWKIKYGDLKKKIILSGKFDIIFRGDGRNDEILNDHSWTISKSNSI